MANSIKYTTGSETLALKKGNFYIGTGDVGKGPTNITGFYNGVIPPSGGYTIYIYNSSQPGDLSYHTASNDSELISFTNSLAGTSYVTVNECLTYYAGQSDKVCLNRDYEGIVTDGLILNVDAGFTPSYPKNGTTWYDLSGNGNNGTLTNGPTFSNNNGGTIVFDGTDDYIRLGTDISLTGEFTMTCFFKKDTNSQRSFLGRESGAGSGTKIIFLSDNNIFFRMTESGTQTNFSIGYETSMNGNWHFVSAVRTSTNLCKASLDGNSFIDGGVRDGTFTFNSVGKNASGQYWDGEMSEIKIYNRALSADEVLQNYNAQKGRFGL